MINGETSELRVMRRLSIPDPLHSDALKSEALKSEALQPEALQPEGNAVYEHNNNNAEGLRTRSPKAINIEELYQEQQIIKSTFVAFRRWASDATRTLRELESRANTAERLALASSQEVLRLQEQISKQNQRENRKRKKCNENERQESSSSDEIGDDADRKQSKI
jgi:hypothetical protein